MKHLLKILLMIPLCVACHSDLDDEKIPQGMKKATIGFKANVENTRTVSTLDDVITDGFSVWGGYEGDAPLTVFDGRKVTTTDDGTTWNYTGPEEYWTYNTYNFHGIYPSPDDAENNYTVTWDPEELQLDLKGFDSSNNTDLLHAAATNLQGWTPKTVTMNFDHLLTNINVELVKDASNANHDIKITGAYIYNLYTKGDICWTQDAQQGQWTPDNTSTYFLGRAIENIADLNVKDTDMDNDGYTSVLSDMLFIPQEISDERPIYLIVIYDYKEKGNDESTYIENKTLTAQLPTTVQWEMGSKITYRATVAAHNNLVFDSDAISVIDWTPEQAGGTIIIK